MKACCVILVSLLVASQAHAQVRDPMQYGRAYLAEGDNALAAQSYNEALRLNPFDPVALNNLAVAKAAGGDYQTAADLLARAARLAPGRPDILENWNRLQQWLASGTDRPRPARGPAPFPGAAQGQLPFLASSAAGQGWQEPPPLWETPDRYSKEDLATATVRSKVKSKASAFSDDGGDLPVVRGRGSKKKCEGLLCK